MEIVEKTIAKKGSQWCVQSEKGKNLGCSPTKAGAHKRLAQVEYFKHRHKSLTEDGIAAALEDGSLYVSENDLAAFMVDKSKSAYLEAKTKYTLALGRNEVPLVTISAGDQNPVISIGTVRELEAPTWNDWTANNILDTLAARGANLGDLIGLWRADPQDKMVVSLMERASYKTKAELGKFFGDNLIIEYNGWPSGWPGMVTVYTNPAVEVKHLPGKHNQKDHGRPATGRELAYGKKKRASSLEPKLRGKEFEGNIIRYVRNTGSDTKERLVIFKDGTGLFIPTPVLLKMAFGSGGKGEIGRKWKTLRQLRQNGFVSWAQANYLYAEKPDTFWDILTAANEGRRVWNPKTKHMDLFDPNTDTEV